MPKVTEEYIEQKKAHIIDSALKVCHKKTLSSITMQDVIDESGLSQGGIYRFYQNVDDILVEVINKIRSTSLVDNDFYNQIFFTPLNELRGEVLNYENIEKRRDLLFKLLEKWYSDLSTFLSEKMHPDFFVDYGLKSMAMNFPERVDYINKNLKFPGVFENEYKKAYEEFNTEVEQGIICPKANLQVIFQQIHVQLNGFIEKCLLEEKLTSENSSFNIQEHVKTMFFICVFMLGLENYLEKK